MRIYKKNPFWESEITRDKKKRKVKRDFDLSVEPGGEEESGAPLEDKEISAKKYYSLFYIFTFLVFLVLFFRLFSLQIISGAKHRELAEGNRLRIRITPAPRGLIYDWNKNLLVKNIPSFSLEIYPADLPRSKKDREKLYQDLALILDLPLSEIAKAEEKRQVYEPVVLKENLTQEEAINYETKLSNFPAVFLAKKPQREYPKKEVLSFVLGYTGKMTEKEREKYPDYLPSALLGKTGLESFYEEYLKGEGGKERSEVDSQGKISRILATQEPVPGKSLILSLDLGFQEKTTALLSETIKRQKAKGGTALAIDPKTGSILTFVSLPTFDNNLFGPNLKKEEYEKLLNDPKNPLFNKGLQGLYPPGSTVKPMIATAALKEGIISPKTTIYDPGFLTITNVYNPQIVYKFPDWKAHGQVDVKKAIAQSCDVFFYTIGGGYGDIKGLGIEKINKWFSKFGLGKKTGIDLPAEKEGFLPTPEWKKKNKKETWYKGDTYHVSIGQGDLLVTPLEMLEVTLALANGGTLYKPHLVSEIRDIDGNLVEKIEPEIIEKDIADRDVLEVVREGMKEAAISGTARILSNLSIQSAGKTGTAQNPQGQPHSWFISFAPYEDPQIATVVMVEEGGEGSEAALPTTYEMLKYWFGERK